MKIKSIIGHQTRGSERSRKPQTAATCLVKENKKYNPKPTPRKRIQKDNKAPEKPTLRLIFASEPPVGGTKVRYENILNDMGTAMPSLKELLARHEALEQELEQARQQEADRTLREIVAKMREYKITLQELMGTKAHAPTVPPVANAKYRDPVTGATWSGRGRVPHWIADKNRDDFLIQPSLFRGQ
jgi:DNA-binding protein H-NS